jgi:hypothetical protein
VKKTRRNYTKIKTQEITNQPKAMSVKKIIEGGIKKEEKTEEGGN